MAVTLARRVWPSPGPPPPLFVQVRHGCAPGSLDVTLARKLGQVCPLLRGVAISLLAGGVGAVPGDGLVVEIRRVPTEFGGEFCTHKLVVFATGHRCSLRLVACAGDGHHDLLLGTEGCAIPLA